MRRIIALAALLVGFSVTPAFCQESVVRQAKADLAAAGFQVEGKACTDFEIAKVVAGRIRGAGLLTKDCCGSADDNNRSHCELNGVWYAHDIVAFADGTLVDIAVDGGGSNGVAWEVAEPDPGLISRYRSAASLGLTGVVAGGSAGPVAPGVPPAVPVVDVSPLIDRIAALERSLGSLTSMVAAMATQMTAANEAAATAQANAATAANGTVDLKNYLKAHPIPDGCRVSYLGCKPTFNYPPVQ